MGLVSSQSGLSQLSMSSQGNVSLEKIHSLFLTVQEDAQGDSMEDIVWTFIEQGLLGVPPENWLGFIESCFKLSASLNENLVEITYYGYCYILDHWLWEPQYPTEEDWKKQVGYNGMISQQLALHKIYDDWQVSHIPPCPK